MPNGKPSDKGKALATYAENPPPDTLLLIISGSWQTQHNFKQELAHYTPHVPIRRITLSTWKTGGWAQLPAYRLDLEGQDEQPMNFQWVGTLEALKTTLQTQGWKSPASLSPVNAISWLAPDPDITALPILPQVNDGQHQSLLLVGPHLANKNRLIILRLWPSELELLPGNVPVWTGNAAYLRQEKDLPLITYLRTGADFEAPLRQLMKTLISSPRIRLALRHRRVAADQTHSQINVLLAWESGL